MRANWSSFGINCSSQCLSPMDGELRTIEQSFSYLSPSQGSRDLVGGVIMTKPALAKAVVALAAPAFAQVSLLGNCWP